MQNILFPKKSSLRKSVLFLAISGGKEFKRKTHPNPSISEPGKIYVKPKVKEALV